MFMSPQNCCGCEPPTVSCTFADTYAGRTFTYTVSNANAIWVIQRYWSGGQIVETRTDLPLVEGSASFVGERYRTYTIFASNDCGVTSANCWEACNCTCWTYDNSPLPRPPWGVTYEIFDVVNYSTDIDFIDKDGDVFVRTREYSFGSEYLNHSRFIPYDLTNCEFEEQECIYLGRVGVKYEWEVLKPFYHSDESFTPWNNASYVDVGTGETESSYNAFSNPALYGGAFEVGTNQYVGPLDLANWRTYRDNPNYEVTCLEFDLAGGWPGPYCDYDNTLPYLPPFTLLKVAALRAAEDISGLIPMFDRTETVQVNTPGHSLFPAPHVAFAGDRKCRMGQCGLDTGMSFYNSQWLTFNEDESVITWQPQNSDPSGLPLPGVRTTTHFAN